MVSTEIQIKYVTKMTNIYADCLPLTLNNCNMDQFYSIFIRVALHFYGVRKIIVSIILPG